MRSKKKKIFINVGNIKKMDIKLFFHFLKKDENIGIYGKKDKKLIKLYFKEIVKCDIFAYISLLNT